MDATEIAAVRSVFDEMAGKAGLSDAVELQFRDTLPNALALSGGTMTVTDGWVRLFKSDEPRLPRAASACALLVAETRYATKESICANKYCAA